MVKPQETADLDTFTEEIFTGKLHILSSVTGIYCQFDCALIALNSITLGAQQNTWCFIKTHIKNLAANTARFYREIDYLADTHLALNHLKEIL